MWRLRDLPEQPFVLLDSLMLAPFFLISTQKPDIKSLGLQKEPDASLLPPFFSSVTFSLLLFSRCCNLSSTTTPYRHLVDVYISFECPTSTLNACKDEDKYSCKRKLRQRMLTGSIKFKESIASLKLKAWSTW